MRVYLQKIGTDSITELSPGVTVALGSMNMDVKGYTASISADIDSIVQGATVNPFVLSVNETPGDLDGGILIEGSECVSWTYTSKTINNNISLNNGNPVKGAILITDMCPSCDTCENIYRLKYELENMKVWINTLKDVNLYTDDEAKSRQDGLEALRVTGATSVCGIYAEDDFQLKATRLFKEYVTMLHMWNYVVSINNYSTVIQLAPETTAGFVVQTKHSVTSCANKIKLQCCIQVTRSGYIPTNASIPAEYSIMSVYVPDDSMKFTHGPFETNGESNPGFSPMDVNPLCITGPEATTKTINSFLNPVEISQAGTYMLEAKFLPFIPSESRVNGKLITADNWKTINTDADLSVVPVAGGTEYTYAYDIVTRLSSSPIMDPTKAQYMNSCIAPSASVDLSVVWNIVITWKIWESTLDNNGNVVYLEPKLEQQSYLYKCNAVSTPCSTLVSIPPTTIFVPDAETNGTNISQ